MEAGSGFVVSTPRTRNAASEDGRVLLPDGIELVRKESCMVVIGPTGQQIEIRPLPSYDPVRNTPRSVFVDRKGECSKLSPRKKWLTGSVQWAKRELTLDKFRLSWGDGSVQLESQVVIEAAERTSPKYADSHRRQDRPWDMGYLTQVAAGEGGAVDGRGTDGVVGRDYCLMVHTPRSLMDRMGALMDRGTVVFLNKPSKPTAPKAVDDEDAPTTFYFSFSSAAERNEWKEAIERNLRYCAPTARPERQRIARTSESCPACTKRAHARAARREEASPLRGAASTALLLATLPRRTRLLVGRVHACGVATCLADKNSPEYVSELARNCRTAALFCGGTLDPEFDMAPYLDQLFSGDFAVRDGFYFA